MEHRAFLVAPMLKNLPAMQETWVQSLGWEDSLEKEKATHSSPWGLKESDVTERLSLSLEHSLALPFFGFGMKTDLFQSCGYC